jgi:hypothetical protein
VIEALHANIDVNKSENIVVNLPKPGNAKLIHFAITVDTVASGASGNRYITLTPNDPNMLPNSWTSSLTYYQPDNMPIYGIPIFHYSQADPDDLPITFKMRIKPDGNTVGNVKFRVTYYVTWP